jgi:hypothetical protein
MSLSGGPVCQELVAFPRRLNGLVLASEDAGAYRIDKQMTASV